MDAKEKTTVKLPDPLASFEEKLSDPYALSIAKTISADWFGGGHASKGCEFLNRREYVRNKRLFVRGELDLGYFKKSISKDEGDLDFINLDFTNINWGEKFCRSVSNALNDKNYKLDIRATDKFATLKKAQKQDFYLKYMKGKPMAEEVKEKFGIDLMPNSFIPEDEEEMQIHMEINDRPKIEIAEEILIDYVFNSNDWAFLENQYGKDLVDVGIIIARIHTDKQNGVMISYVDSENYIHSKVKRNDFADKYYEGVVDTITLSDLKRESNFDDDTLREIAKAYGNQNSNILVNNYDNCNFDDIIDYKISVLRYAFKTSKKLTYKKKIRNGETVKVSKKDSNYQPPNRDDTGAVSGTFDTWLEGNYIIGSKFVYGHKECENNYDDIMNKAMSPFVTVAYDVYENRLRSFTDNIEAAARQLQKISLKVQQLVSELTPDLKEIDLDMLAELDDSKGGSKKEVWQTALTIMSAKGVIFKKRINGGEDGIKDSAAARPLPSQQGSALTILLNVWAHYYNFIRDNTGVNPARDGSMSANSLVGVNQLAQLASNTITANIVEASIYFKKKISEVISTRIHTIFKYKEAKKVKEVYENVVGKIMLDAMEILKDRHLHEFGFTFEMNPTAEEIKEFNEVLNLSVQDGTIDAEVVFQAKQIARVNVKKAIEYLMFKRRKRMKKAMEDEMAKAGNKSKNDAMAAQAKVEAELKAYQAKKEIDLQSKRQELQMELEQEQALMQIRAPKEQEEFKKEIYLAKIDSMTSLEKERFKEDSKDNRTKLQATQQSKMKQANENDAPIDFEMESDWALQE